MREVERLAEGEVEFVVVDGYAAVLHGSTQVTQDLDVCIEFSAVNIERLRRLLADLDPRHRMTTQKLSLLEVPPPGTEMKNLSLRTRLGVIDFLSDILEERTKEAGVVSRHATCPRPGGVRLMQSVKLGSPPLDRSTGAFYQSRGMSRLLSPSISRLGRWREERWPSVK